MEDPKDKSEAEEEYWKDFDKLMDRHDELHPDAVKSDGGPTKADGVGP